MANTALLYSSFLTETIRFRKSLQKNKKKPMSGKTNVVLLPITIILLLLHVPHCSSSGEVEDEHPFDYSRGSGKGPEHWGRINPEWKICNAGLMQSPIDLLDERVEIMPELGRLRRNYKPAGATLTNRGHDIMLKWKQEVGTITIDGVKFHLTQCHWHSPSEHSFNGSRYQLELHMVHESRRGDIAVVGSIYKYGKPDPFLSKLIPHIRDLEEDEKDVGIVNPIEMKIGARRYFRYMGSLTVPPCTEGVIWTIANKVRTVSREQVSALREAVHDGFEANARPVQSHNDRTVMLYNPTDDPCD